MNVVRYLSSLTDEVGQPLFEVSLVLLERHRVGEAEEGEILRLRDCYKSIDQVTKWIDLTGRKVHPAMKIDLSE